MKPLSTRIMVVNDDPSQILLITEILERAEHTVQGFTDPAKALHALSRNGDIDLVLVDLHMPVIDGWRFCRVLRSPDFERYNSTPILIVSATFTGTDVEAVTADLGANAFMPVPFTADGLRSCVDDLLAGKRPQSMLSVLIVEDDVAVRRAVGSVFERNGYRVHFTASAEEAEDVFFKIHPDVLVLDYHLPGLDGAAFLKMVRRPGDSMVSIVMTGDPDPDLPVNVLRHGATAFVRKPFDADYILDLAQKARRERSLLRIEEILDGRTRELKASESRYRSLFDAIPEAVLLLDGAGTIVKANRAAHDQFQADDAPLVGRSFRDLTASERVIDLEAALSRCWNEGAATFESTFLAADGSAVHVEVTGRVTEYQDADALLVVSRDISERKRIEQERRRMEARTQHAQKLESLGVLAGGIAHDFNNLLMGVLGNASLAQSDLDPSHPAWESLQQIEVAAHRAAELTGQILTFSGKGPISMEPLCLTALVREMGQLLEPAVSKKSEIRYTLTKELPSVRGDSSQLRQVVMNLLMNASDALEGEVGVIRMSTHVGHVGAEVFEDSFLGEDLEPGRYVALEVTDTGCGMDAKTIKRMFDPFYTTKLKGRGLGLAAVLGIVRAHSGAITVSSVPGHGTTITVYLPAAGERKQADRDRDGPDGSSWKGYGKILLVEDESAVRDVLKAVLRRSGFDVLAAEDGEEGLALFKAHGPEIRATILDLTMPGLDGEQVLAAIRVLDPEALVILSSGYAEVDVLERLECSVSGFIQKPYQPAILVDTLRAILEPAPAPSVEVSA